MSSSDFSYGGMKYTLVGFLKLSIFLFLTFSILDPVGNVFKLKIIFFVVSAGVFLLLALAGNRVPLRRDLVVLVISVAFFVPFLSYLVVLLSGFQEVDNGVRLQYLIAFVPLLLLLPVSAFGIKTHILSVLPLTFLVVTIFITFVLSSLNVSLGFKLGAFLDQGISAAKIGSRDFNGLIVYMVYYKTSVLLVFLMAYFATRRSFSTLIICAFITVVLIISATRANALMGMWLFSAYLYFYLNDRNRVFSYFYIILVALITLVLFLLSYQYFFSAEEVSNQIKIGHILGYAEHFSQAGASLIFGSGAGTGFYTPGYDKFIFSSELSYFELYRVYGFLSLPFLVLLTYPLFKFRLLGREYTVAWIAYLLVAGTNPLLVSSTGMIAIIVIYGKLIQNIKEGGY